MTLTPERLKWLHDAATELSATKLKMTMRPDELLVLTSELLANREAQPVALVDRRPAAIGSICWQNGGKDLAHGTELFTAPPASAVPDEISSAIRYLKDTLVACNRFNYCADAVNRVEDACRDAMLKGEKS